VLGVVAFRASPVWVLAGMADLCGLGRHLIPQLADEMKQQGLLDATPRSNRWTRCSTGSRGRRRAWRRHQHAAARRGVAAAEWNAIREEARTLQPSSLPSPRWSRTVGSAARRGGGAEPLGVRDVVGARAVAVRVGAGRIRWLSASAWPAPAARDESLAVVLLDHYRETLDEVRQTERRVREPSARPYVRAAVAQFSPEQRTLTERIVDRISGMLERRSPDGPDV
jgi:hypothetical protein